MKKIFSVVLLSFLMLCGCSQDQTSVKIITPTGSPALSQVYMQGTTPSLGDNVTYEIDVVEGQDPLVAAFTNGTYDIIYAPSNLGVKMYNNNASYLLLGTVVWGNLYFATCQEEPFELSDINNQEITLFGQSTVPGIVAETILAKANVVPSSKTYLASTANTVPALIKDNQKIILVAEPSLSNMKAALEKSGVTSLKTINLTDIWKDLTETEGFPQACVFVKKEFVDNKDVLDKFVEALKQSCDKANSESTLVAKKAVELEYAFTEDVLTGAIQRSNIEFKSANDSKQSMEYFLNTLKDGGFGNLFGNDLPDEEFYY